MPVKLEQIGALPVTDNRAIYESIPLPDQRRIALDVGAFVGEWTNLLACDFRVVIAFEIRANNRAVLKQNAPSNAIVAEVGLGERIGMETFTLRSAGAKGGRYAQNTSLGRNGPREVLPVVNLDAYMLDEVDLIKLDTDGGERGIIYGGLETIWRNKPMIVIETKFLNDWGKHDLLRVINYRVLCKVSPIDEVWVARDHP